MTFVWIVIAAVVLLVLLSKRKDGKQSGSVRIDHPHVIDDDDYECPICHRRFQVDLMTCPYCGAKFTGRTEDSTEWDEEEDEMEAWDEEG